jgi:hypothetical protein
MATLQEKIDRLKAQDQGQEQQAPAEDQGGESWLYRAPAQFNVGLAQMLGLPKIGADVLRQFAGYQEESGLPSGSEIQQTMADLGMTYEPDEQPETIPDRILQNLGAASLPVAGTVGRAYKAGRSIAPLLMTEGAASTGGAVGGKALEATEWGQENPLMARAIGELGGGLGASSTAAARKIPRAVLRSSPIGLAKAPFRGEWARSRAVKRLANVSDNPQLARERLARAREAPDMQGLTGSQMTGDRGVARLRRRVETDVPEEGEYGVRQRSEVTQEALETASESEEGLADTRGFLDRRFQKLAQEAKDALQKARASDNPVTYNKQARQKLEKAYNLARQKESQVWQNLPEGEPVVPQSLMDTYREEFSNITEGGDIQEIDSFVRQKLGRIGKKGGLTGGELVNESKQLASPKALHQFYSRLSRRVRELSDSSGQTNKIRILNRLRSAALEDLEQSGVGEDYQEAIRFSRDLNEKFTSGEVGKVLGFQRGQSTSETMTLDDIIGSGGQEAKENVQQLLRSTPEAEDDIKNFIRTRFAAAAENQNNARINRQAGQKFVQKHKRLLEAFPDLRSEMEDAIKKQSQVDEFVGATDVSEMSPLVKERAATSIFLGADPGDEMNQVIRQGVSKGKTTDYLRDLVKQTRKDPTGKARKGLKNSLVSELIESSRIASKEDPITSANFVSGKRFLKRLSDLEEPIQKSGLMDKDELNRLKRIGKTFRNVEQELQAGAQEGSIVGDAPGTILDVVVRVPMARLGAAIGGSSAAGGIQSAGIMSGLGSKLARKLTNDEARNLLIKATRDPKLMDDLLKDVEKVRGRQQQDLLNRIVSQAKDLSSKAGRRIKRDVEQTEAPASAVTPPLVSGGKAAEEEAQDRRIRAKLKAL